MSAPSNRPRNRLLLALPPADLERLMPELEHIRCARGEVLMDADSPLDHVFFPDSGVISVVAVYALDLRHASRMEQVETALAALRLRLIVDVARAA